MAEWYEHDGGPVCGDCHHGCPRPPHYAACDVDGCRCECRPRLAEVARAIQAERYDTTGLTVERYGPAPRRWR